MDDDTLDQAVGNALGSDDEAVDRMVRRALDPRRPRRPVWGILVVATAGATLLASALLVMSRNAVVNGPSPVRLTNVGATIVVDSAPDGIWLVGAEGADDDRLPPGTIIVYRSGGTR